jgi:putative membrane protein
MITIATLFLAFHVFGVILWVAGLVGLTILFAAARAESDVGVRKRLLGFARKAGRVPDAGATIALIFGLHWLFAYKMYKFHYMHAKLLFVVFLVGLHGFLRAKTKRAAESGDASLPAFVRPALAVIVLAIVFFVITKFPA